MQNKPTLKLFAFFALFAVSGMYVSPAAADTVIYRSKNKIDFIKTDKAKKDEKEGGLQHPYTLDPERVRTILRSLHFNKKSVVQEDIEDSPLLKEKNVEFLTPYLIEAFAKAGPEEVVVVSYFTRKSTYGVTDDRLTVFRAFVKEDGLHFKFTKLYAKLLGDRTTAGADRIANQARGLRVGLELQPGQGRISWNPEEIVIDLNYFLADGKTAAPSEKNISKPSKQKENSETATAPSSKTKPASNIRERLKELDQLRKDEMITEKEYQRKRQELIKEL